MLEQIAYQLPRTSEQKQVVYQVGDLESLSATVLYTGHLPPMGPGGFGFSSAPKSGPSGKLPSFQNFGIVKTAQMSGNIESIEPATKGMILPGGLTIKDLIKNSAVFQEDFGGVGNIYTFHPDGHGALRFYGNETVDGKKKGKDREKKESSW